MRTTLTAAVCALSAVTLAACSGTTSGKSGPDAQAIFPAAHSSAKHSPSAVPSPYPTAGRPTQSPGGVSSTSAAQRDVDRVLLTARQLGSGFVQAADAAPSALPCTPTAPPVDDQVRHVEKGNVVFVDDVAGEQVSEQIYVYSTVADAQRHERIVQAGLACARGVMQGARVRIAGPTDIHGKLAERNDTAQGWAVETAQVSGVLVAVRIHAVLVQFAVVAENGSAPDIDAKQVVETGLKNILRAVASS